MKKYLGENLARARERLGMTQEELAEQLDVSFQTVSNWERGENLPDVMHLAQAAKVLGVSIDSLTSPVLEKPALRERFFDENSMYTRVKAVAEACSLTQTLAALPYARAKHEGQWRKSIYSETRIPYIYHPLTLACHALAMGLRDDRVLATALLHDVYEDCGVELDDLPVNDEIKEAVRLLSHNSYEGPDEECDPIYYANIASSPLAAVVKCLDRCHNLSSMALGFSREKIASYIRGTEKYVVPILEKLSALEPTYSNAAWLMKYQMLSLLEMAKRLV